MDRIKEFFKNVRDGILKFLGLLDKTEEKIEEIKADVKKVEDKIDEVEKKVEEVIKEK